MRYLIPALAASLLLGCAPQQLAVNRNGQAPVCAVKAGQRQSYWNEAVAGRDGAIILLAGECPASPNSEGGVGGSGGM
jgi:hypothetical protein